MSRTALIRHLESCGCVRLREGAKYTIYKNPTSGAFSAIPRHRVLKKFLAYKICDDLGVPRP